MIYGIQGLENNNFAEGAHLVIREASTQDDAHLLDKRAFTALPSSCQGNVLLWGS